MNKSFQHIPYKISTTVKNNHTVCCKYQIKSYARFGQQNGMSPMDYINLLLDFSTGGKLLNVITGKYNRHLCANVISTLGFGYGPIRRRGDLHDAIYILPPSINDEYGFIYFFSFDSIQQHLTFDWFKLKVVCEEQPWVCREDERQRKDEEN
ncbi:uncharacterized protein LOC142348718 [Convolutriloba macropyga]|uniref:uncharacterized protein LOC142348718 n=1 Tax=Convolutriloba macropyga TaxID=536237 RepID=UPI003F523405